MLEKETRKLAAALKDSFEKVRQEALAEGLREGIRTATTISNWWKINPSLKEPLSHEELLEWTKLEITKLEQQLANLQGINNA